MGEDFSGFGLAVREPAPGLDPQILPGSGAFPGCVSQGPAS